jgi:hypothetical protein
MNSGRRNSLPFVLYDYSDAPFGKLVAAVQYRDVPQYGPKTHPISNAGTDDSYRKAHRQVIDPGDATFWDDHAESDQDCGYNKS